MTKRIYITLIALICTYGAANAQFGKLKGLMGGKKDTAKTEKADTSAKASSGKNGQSLWSKAITKIAKVAGNVSGSAFGLVATTADLDKVVPGAAYMTNLHPAEVGVIAQSFFEGWEPGGNGIILSFTSKNSTQVNKIDGTVNIDGKPANYAAMGVYSTFIKGTPRPVKVEVVSKNGQKSSYTVNPPVQNVKLLSVNGQQNNINVDLTKDVVLELNNTPADSKSPVLVWLSGSAIGLKTFYEVGWFEPAAKITIPAAMFRNMNGGTNNIGFSGAFLQVTRGSYDKPAGLSGTFPTVDVATLATDGKFINVTGKPTFNKGLEAEGKEKFSAGEVAYSVKKPHALLSPDFARMKNLGVISFAVQGTTSFYDVKTSKLTNIETTKTASFPQFPDAVWDDVLNQLYTEITGVLRSEFNVTVMPLDKITSSAGYQSIAPYSKNDQNTTENFSRAYKNTKLLLGMRPLSEMNGIKSGEHKIMAETGANALLKLTLNLDINFEGAKAFMTPKLVFDINGDARDGYLTSYLSGTITGKGIPYKGNVTPQILSDVIIRKADLIATFKKALQEIKAKELANGDYKTEWDAQVKF